MCPAPLLLLFAGTARPRSIMSVVSLTVDRVDRTPTGGFTVLCNGGNFVKEFATLAELQQYADAANLPDVEMLARTAMAHWLTQSADAADDSKIEGKQFTFDPAQNLAILQVG